jgi:hypothetical protein
VPNEVATQHFNFFMPSSRLGSHLRPVVLHRDGSGAFEIVLTVLAVVFAFNAAINFCPL